MQSQHDSSPLAQTLAERGSRYGSFAAHAAIAQSFKRIAESSRSQSEMTDFEKQALDVIFDKIARMLNGDPHYMDNWHDIQGYAKLVEDILKGQPK